MIKATVLVCETNYLCKEGLKAIINRSPFYSVTGEASSYLELDHKLKLNKFDIVTLDFQHEGEFDVESISLIQERLPAAVILIISQELDKHYIFEVLGRGIDHYITKSCREDEIIHALDSCRKNQKYYCPAILDIIINKTFGDNKEVDSELSGREKEIVVLIAQGKMAKEISHDLNISIHTIYTHRKNIMKKLKISSPVELITYAINNKLVTLT